MKKLLGLFFMLFIALPVMAADISGVIKDKNETLPGVNVKVAGTTTGTATDMNGNFSLSNVPSDAMIEVSYVGYEKQTIPVKDIGNTVLLVEEVQSLDEVGVMGTFQSTACKGEILPENAASGMTKQNPDGNGVLCVIDKCKDGFFLDTNNNKCLGASGPCADGDNVMLGHYIIRNNQRLCIPDTCLSGYEVVNEKCVAISGPCNKKALPANATSGQRKFDIQTRQEICIATSCDEGYTLTNDKCDPELSEKESSDRLTELQANATAMKDKQQSDGNKLLGAAAIGAAGIGGSMALSGQAEKNADADAERDMAAYLATFRCDFGQGQNIRGGEKNIVLPGGNDLMPLYTEYKALAMELKATKEALGMTAGIEAETVFDKADTGLYDNESLGRQSGTFASVANALSDKTGEDAAEWESQKSDAASKAKTGMIVAGAGIVGGAVGNMALNSGKNVAKEKSDEINEKYKNGSSNTKDTADTSASNPTGKTPATKAGNATPTSSTSPTDKKTGPGPLITAPVLDFSLAPMKTTGTTTRK